MWCKYKAKFSLTNHALIYNQKASQKKEIYAISVTIFVLLQHLIKKSIHTICPLAQRLKTDYSVMEIIIQQFF